MKVDCYTDEIIDDNWPLEIVWFPVLHEAGTDPGDKEYIYSCDD